MMNSTTKIDMYVSTYACMYAFRLVVCSVYGCIKTGQGVQICMQDVWGIRLSQVSSLDMSNVQDWVGYVQVQFRLGASLTWYILDLAHIRSIGRDLHTQTPDELHGQIDGQIGRQIGTYQTWRGLSSKYSTKDQTDYTGTYVDVGDRGCQQQTKSTKISLIHRYICTHETWRDSQYMSELMYYCTTHMVMQEMCLSLLMH